MISVLYAACVASTMWMPAIVGVGTAVPSRQDSDQAVSTSLRQVTTDDGGAATGDGTRFAVSGAARETAGPPAPRSLSGTSSRRSDSLWNGALVGAGLGALLGAVGGQAVLECSECAGFNVPLTFGVIGAGAGAAIGAGLDALRHTRSPTPNIPGRITLTPLLGKGRRAVVGRIRF